MHSHNKKAKKKEITRKNASSTDGPPYAQRYGNKTNNILTSKGTFGNLFNAYKCH